MILSFGETILLKKWCLGPDLNRHARVNEAQDFKSCVSTNFTTEAFQKVKFESKGVRTLCHAFS